MNIGALHGSALVTGLTGSSRIEVGLVGAALVIVVLLLVAKAWSRRRLKVRKAAGEGYYDRDAARLVGSRFAATPDPGPVRQGEGAVAPTFISGGGRPTSGPSADSAAPAGRDPLPAFGDPALGEPPRGGEPPVA